MPTENQLVRELLEDARRMRTPEQKAAFEQKLMSGGKGPVPYPAPLPTEKIRDVNTASGTGRPVDFIQPYYGDGFSTEVAKAMLYNARQPKPVLTEESYSRLYDAIPFKRDQKNPRGASYAPKTSEVELPNAESVRIGRANADTYKEWEADSSDKKYQGYAKNYARSNSYLSAAEAADWEKKGGEDASEHEFTHHATRPAGGGVADRLFFDDIMGLIMDEGTSDVLTDPKTGEKVGDHPQDYFGYHTARSSELTQAASRFQRELFAHTGKRIEKPDDFEAIVESDDPMDFMTPEARRYLVFARRIAKDQIEPPTGKPRADERRKDIIRKMAEILPATVNTDDSFQSRVSERLNALPT
jgi:hypothetical protein